MESCFSHMVSQVCNIRDAINYMVIFSCTLGVIHNCQHKYLNVNIQNINYYRPLSLKMCTHQHFSNKQFAMKMIKKLVKMWKMYRINSFFPLITIKEYVLYTRLNVDNYYGQPFRNTG